MRWGPIAVVGVLLLVNACSDDAASGDAAEAVRTEVPEGDPRDLPKVPADEAAIRAMLAERFGEPVARTLRIGVDRELGAVRVRVTGEAPNDEIRVAVMDELSARVEGLVHEDFNLAVAGPIPMIWGFDAPVERSEFTVFSPDLSIAATQRGELYEVATGRRLNRLGIGWMTEITSAAFAPDGRTLATGHQDGTILLWEMPLGAAHKVLAPGTGPTASQHVRALQFTRDGRSIVSLNRVRGELHLWDLGRSAARLIGAHKPDAGPHDGYEGTVMAVSPDGTTVASADPYGGVVLWDVAKRRRGDELKGELFHPQAIAWSPDGRYLAAGRFNQPITGTVLVWDMQTKKSMTLQPDETVSVGSIMFSPDGKTLATQYDDGDLRLWDLPNGRAWLDIDRDKVGARRAVFSPDGAVLATVSRDLRPPGIRLWDVSQRPGASGTAARLPAALGAAVAPRDDLLVQEIDAAIRGTFDERNIEALAVEVLPDGRVRLRGRVSSQEVKDVAGRIVSTRRDRDDPGGPSKVVINELEVTGRYGSPGKTPR